MTNKVFPSGMTNGSDGEIGKTAAKCGGGLESNASLLVGGDGFRFIVENVEDGVELGDLQQVLDLLGQLQQLEGAAGVLDRRQGADQLADAGAVDVIDVRQIEEDLVGTLGQDVAYGVPDGYASLTQHNLSTQIQDCDSVDFPARKLHAHSVSPLAPMFDQCKLRTRSQLAKVYLIHVRAHKENATTGWPEEIFLGERVGNCVRIEPLALVRDNDFEVGAGEFEADRDVFGRVFFIAVQDGVDGGLTGDHGNIGRRVLVKASFAGVSFCCLFDRMNALEVGVEGHGLAFYLDIAQNAVSPCEFLCIAGESQGESGEWGNRRGRRQEQNFLRLRTGHARLAPFFLGKTAIAVFVSLYTHRSLL